MWILADIQVNPGYVMYTRTVETTEKPSRMTERLELLAS